MATTRFRTRRRRARKRFVWVGNALPSDSDFDIATAGDVPGNDDFTIVGLVVPNLDGNLDTASDVLLERGILDFMVYNDNEDFAQLNMYITTVPSGIELVGTGGLWPPLMSDIDADAFNKRPLWYRSFLLDPATTFGTGKQIPLVDINVKRKLGGDMALVWCLNVDNNADVDVLSFQARVLCSVGRK